MPFGSFRKEQTLLKVSASITFARKNKKKSSIYFVILSLIRNFKLRSNLLSLGKKKKILRFILFFSRLYVTLLRKVFKTEP